MLTIRLQRVGRKNDPSFRVVVTDSKNGPQSGKFLEILGSYNARFGKPTLNADRIKHWLSKGAGISDTVRNMLIHFKVIEGVKTNPLPPKKEAPVVESAPEVAPVAEKVAEEATPEVVEEAQTPEQSTEAPAPEVLAEEEKEPAA